MDKAIEAALAAWFETTDELYTKDPDFKRRMQAAIAAYLAASGDGEKNKIYRLWALLDDIDTYDDMAKADEDLYRSLVRRAHAKRFEILSSEEIDSLYERFHDAAREVE